VGNTLSVEKFSGANLVNGTVGRGHTKKRPGHPETSPIPPGVLEYCLNQIFVEIIMEYDVK
jgi:hypothetical protein